MVATVTRIICRRLIALAAAYAVALQAVVAGFAVLSAVGQMPGLCASGAPEAPGSDRGHAVPCIACPVTCSDGGLPGAAPAGVAAPPRAAAVRIGHRMLRLAERSAPRNLPPSRAPPSA
jgi:hypothetical protein